MFRTVIPSGVEGSGVVGSRVLHHPPGSLDSARDDSNAFVILSAAKELNSRNLSCFAVCRGSAWRWSNQGWNTPP